jgi:hypothetical protein
MSYEPEGYESPIVNLVSEVGPAPEGVDQVDYIIASLPPKELTRAAKDSTFSYEGLKQKVDEDPEFLDRYNAVPHPSKTLADTILNRQHHLSRHRRRFATVASVLVLGAGGFVYGFDSGRDMSHEVLHPRSDTPQQQAEDRDQGIKIGLALGGAAGALGGFVTGLTALSFSGRLARRPAQRLVDRARATSDAQ